MQQQWSAVDNFMISSLIPQDDVLQQVLENNKRAGLPEHDVAANQGQLLALFVRMTQARRVLEIGTLGAYSSIWMARALPLTGSSSPWKQTRPMLMSLDRIFIWQVWTRVSP
jgi:predicted O-methyltransferase YrrM